MGAAASVNSNTAGYENAANGIRDAVGEAEGAGVASITAVNIPDIPAVSVPVPDVDIDARMEQVRSAVGPEQREAVWKMLQGSRSLVPLDQMGRALEEIEKALPTAQGAAMLVAVAGALGAASNMAPEIVSLVGGAVLSLGEHLPYLGIAAGAIGAIIYTFRLSKDQDENVKTVTTWLESVKDWLFLVAEKVVTSGAASTVPLFQGLQDALLNISTQMDDRNRKWRITKMLSSTQFERDFMRVKTAIIELKTALRDYLDEETQNRQEAQLGSIASTQVDTNEKLSSIDDQLTQIKALLREQAEAAARASEASKSSLVQVKDDEEAIYLNIQRAAGTEGDVDFKRFVAVFEAFFYNGEDMPPEQKRALKIAMNIKSSSGLVSKATWIKFYRKWTSSKVNMETFLVSIAEENPTAYQKGYKLAQDALAARGIESMDDAKAALLKKADDMKAKAEEMKAKAEAHMGHMSLPFGKKVVAVPQAVPVESPAGATGAVAEAEEPLKC
jgi:hypothetical protein